MAKYIMAHDLGTSSDKAALVDFEGNVVASETCAYPTYYPKPAWVEQNPEDYWTAVCTTCKKVLETTGIDKDDVKAMIFSTQAQGVIPVDKDGKALYNNITWIDSRAQKQAEHVGRVERVLIDGGETGRLTARTGENRLVHINADKSLIGQFRDVLNWILNL